MHEIVFLEAKNQRRLSKVYTQAGITSYPLVKEFRSHHNMIDETFEGFHRKFELIQENAALGNAMLRGRLKKPLKNEPRAGQSDRNALNNTILIDIDGIRMSEDLKRRCGTYQQGDLKVTAEEAISHLPAEFRNASYIAQASNSFGLKQHTISLHIEFMLSEPVSPRLLKLLLKGLNFQSRHYESQISLTPSGHALSYRVDPTTADNSRIIYIAPPLIRDPIVDPFPHPEDRTIFVRKPEATINISVLIEDLNPQTIDSEAEKKIKQLRSIQGLPPRKLKTQSMRQPSGETITVQNNPDRVNIEIIREEGSYLRCNINGGDSQAYYIKKSEPHVVYNFKGELPFLLTVADPELFTELSDKYIAEVGVGNNGEKPIMFRDMSTDVHYAGQINVKTNQILRLDPIGVGNRKDFMEDYGQAVPEITPQYDYIFAPHDPRFFDPEGRFVNRYTQSTYLADPKPLPEHYCGLAIGEATKIEGLCPTIYKVIFSMTGADPEEFEYFINWFAYVVQKKRKSGTAYITHGTPGTGKGLFYSAIASKLLGQQSVMNISLSQLLDLSNLWAAQTLFVIVDEFRMNDFTNASKVNNTLKRLITERRLSIRAMRQDNVEMNSYTNFMFASNDTDMIKIADGDRRLNVCPAQTMKLFDRYPEIEENISTSLAKELPSFASFLLSWNLNEQAALTVRETEAKVKLRKSSTNVHDAFFRALKNGDLDYFLDYLNEQSMSDIEMQFKTPFDNILKQAVPTLARDNNGDSTIHKIKMSDISAMYARILNKYINPKTMGKIIDINNIPWSRPRLGPEGRQIKAVEVNWSITEYDYATLVESLLPEREREALGIELADTPQG